MKRKLTWVALAAVAVAPTVALASALGQLGGRNSAGAAPSELYGVNGAGIEFTCYLLDDSGTEPSYACPSASWYVDPRTADPGGGDPACWANNRPSMVDTGPHPCQLLIDDGATALNLSDPGVFERPNIGNRALLAPTNLKSDDPIFSGASCWAGIRTYFGTTYSSRPVVAKDADRSSRKFQPDTQTWLDVLQW